MQLKDGLTVPFEGVAFDMDGTLINSTLLIENLWRDWAALHGVEIELLLKEAHGRKAVDIVRLFAPAHLDPDDEARKLTLSATVAIDGLQEVRGAADLLRSLPRNCWAVVTSAEKDLATKWMSHLQLPLPNILISAEDVSEGKPSPLGYLQAASRLNCDPASMIVFEDALNGFTAGERAGAHVIVLSTTLSPQQIGDRHWIRDFTEVHVDGRALSFN